MKPTIMDEQGVRHFVDGWRIVELRRVWFGPLVDWANASMALLH